MPELKFLIKEKKVVKKNALKVNTKCFLFFLFAKLTLEINNSTGTFGGKSREGSWLTFRFLEHARPCAWLSTFLILLNSHNGLEN